MLYQLSYGPTGAFLRPAPGQVKPGRRALFRARAPAANLRRAAAGNPPEIAVNPANWLVRTAQIAPEAPALMIGETPRGDYAAFARAAAGIGAALRARGVAPGERAALFMPNRIEFLEALYGIWFAGAVAAPINARLHPREAAWILEHCGARLVFAAPQTAAALREAIGPGGPEIVDVAEDAFAAMRKAPPLPAPAPMTAEDPAWLFYTSGTTGRPKGVVIHAGALMAMTLSYFADVDEVRPGDAALYAAPMSHGAGLYNFMHVIRGARHVVPPSGGFDADEILDLTPRLGDVHMFAAPTMVRRLVDRARARGLRGEGLRTVVYGGGPMYLADIEEAVAVMGPRFVQIYGQGECPMCITALSRRHVADRAHPRWRARLASVGRAQSATEIRIAGPDGAPLPPGRVGEIEVRGPAVMRGYWNAPEATARALRDGWLRTGDVGALDEEGFLTLHDRSKDVVISGGSNIYPREVEEVLLQHPAVHEAACVGRPHPEWGEELVAFVCPAPGAAPDPAELEALCLSRIARYKRPRAWFALPELPKNNYGKVLKTELRRMLAEGRPRPLEAPQGDEA